jgi:Tol biopolymer transport system component
VLGLALGAVVAVAFLLYAFSIPPPQPRILNTTPLTSDGQGKTMSAPILAGGSRIYFREDSIGLVSVPVAGGQIERASTPRALLASDISADGLEFLGIELHREDVDNPLCTWPVSGGPPRRLGDLRGVAAAWSPDRSKIVYTTADALYVADAGGGNRRRLVSVPGRPEWPRWSPGGDVIRFTVFQRGDAWSLWEVAASGGNLHQLLSGWNTRSNECCGAWTPDGRYYIFQSTQDGRADIWALPEYPGFLRWRRPEPVRVTAGPMSYYAPQPGKDSKKLFVIGEQTSVHLERYDRATGAFQPYLPGVAASQVDFSRDGNWMVYTRYPEHTLWRRRLDRSETQRLTDPTKLLAFGPSWSPDGKQIAFMGKLPDGRYRVCLVPAHGGDVAQPVPGDQDQGIPTWSPDGKQIAFGELLHRRDTSEMTIHVFNFEGRELSTLPESAGLWTARWSPDGRYIAALRAHWAGPSELRLFESARQRWTLLASSTDTISEATWSRDGAYVYLGTTQRDPALYRVRVPGGKPERLASLKGIPLTAEAWSGVTPDGSPLISRAEVFEEIYALDVEWR